MLQIGVGVYHTDKRKRHCHFNCCKFKPLSTNVFIYLKWYNNNNSDNNNSNSDSDSDSDNNSNNNNNNDDDNNDDNDVKTQYSKQCLMFKMNKLSKSVVEQVSFKSGFERGNKVVC